MDALKIPFERVDTYEAITNMEDCILINKKLDMKMVKTLFLCNRRKTLFFIFVTCGDKPFNAETFSKAMNCSRVSFASEELFLEMLGTKIGAAAVFSALKDLGGDIHIAIDQDAASEEFYRCSDGTTTCYLKIKTEDIINKCKRQIVRLLFTSTLYLLHFYTICIYYTLLIFYRLYYCFYCFTTKRGILQN